MTKNLDIGTDIVNLTRDLCEFPVSVVSDANALLGEILGNRQRPRFGHPRGNRPCPPQNPDVLRRDLQLRIVNAAGRVLG